MALQALTCRPGVHFASEQLLTTAAVEMVSDWYDSVDQFPLICSLHQSSVNHRHQRVHVKVSVPYVGKHVGVHTHVGIIQQK